MISFYFKNSYPFPRDTNNRMPGAGRESSRIFPFPVPFTLDTKTPNILKSSHVTKLPVKRTKKIHTTGNFSLCKFLSSFLHSHPWKLRHQPAPLLLRVCRQQQMIYFRVVKFCFSLDIAIFQQYHCPFLRLTWPSIHRILIRMDWWTEHR